MSDPVLSARSLGRSFTSGGRTIEVLRGLDLDVTAGESVAIVGDSGVGKSTLLYLLGGLDAADGGEVRFRGRVVSGGGARAMAEFRNLHVGFVFQFHHLLPEFSAVENVEMPFRIGRRAETAHEEAVRLLERLGLGERLHHRPGALSGGEQQRVAIARAVAPGPAVVLADEPTGNLDPTTGSAVFAVLRELQRERRFALVVATHSERLATSCDRMLRLEDGALRAIDAGEARSFFGGRGDDRGTML